jgi:hypothetical protein
MMERGWSVVQDCGEGGRARGRDRGTRGGVKGGPTCGAAKKACLHMHDPCEPHLTATKCILWYLQGTLSHGMLLHHTSTLNLIVYTDAEWAGSPDTHRSTSGYVVFLGDNLVSWSSKRQNVVARSSAEVEYRVVVNGMKEACWLRQLLVELHNPLPQATLVYCDNVSTVYLSTNPVQHQRTKHVEMIFTLSTSALPLWTFVSSMSRQLLSSLTSSPWGCPPRYSQSFGPISTFLVVTVSTAGGRG